MPLVNMSDMLDHAYRHGYAVGAFDLVSLDFLEAIMAGAEACQAPVILSLAESHFEYYDFELAMAATVAAARRARVPVAIHLDHGASVDSAVNAIRLGCTGVMVDASTLPFTENLRITRQVADMAHSCGVPVEGELGYVAGVEGEDAQKHPGAVVYTSPQEAREFVRQTEVDFLAVSIGTVHGRMQGEPKLDLERLEAIRQAVDIPLVIHGGTGLSDEQFHALIARGVAKINYYTALSDAAAARIGENFRAASGAGYTRLLAGVRTAIQDEVERRIRLWGGADRTAEVLEACRPWQEVEHFIVYNLSGEAESHADEFKAIGRDMLARVPGVRRVVSGRARQEDARYRHCWLIRFAGIDTITSYMAHPDHVAYADQYFRPHAGDRLKIDYVLD